MSERQIRMEVFLRQELVASLSFPQVRVNDGEWHHLLVELRSAKDGKDIKYVAYVSLDYGMYQVQANGITAVPPCTAGPCKIKKRVVIIYSFQAEVSGAR